MDGYIRLHRSLLMWEWWDEPNTARLWITLLLLASFGGAKWHGNTILPGQIMTSISSLSKKTKLSIRSIRTSLERLKSTGEIAIETTSQFSLVTIVNWEKFQLLGNELTSRMTSDLTSERQTSDKQTTNERQHRKNVKKDKNIYNPPISPFEVAIENFKEMRVKIKRPMTDHAVDLLVAKLQRLAGDDESLKIKILEQSTFKCWLGVFPLQDEKQEGGTPKKWLI